MPCRVRGAEVEQLDRVRRGVIVVAALVEDLSVNPATADRHHPRSMAILGKQWEQDARALTGIGTGLVALRFQDRGIPVPWGARVPETSRVARVNQHPAVG